MARWSRRKIAALVGREWRSLTTINSSDRPWQMPLAAALSSGLPLLIGAGFDRLAYGLISSIGGLVFLYLPTTALHHRMVVLMACGFGMTGCYTFGLMTAFIPLFKVPVLGLLTVLVLMVCRFYRMGPPGPVFFVMAASIGAYSPATVDDLPHRVGLLAMGCLLAALIGFIYSLIILRLREPALVAPYSAAPFSFVVVEPVIIGAFVGLSLAIAQLLHLDRPYWVPISALAVIQGLSLRAIWTRQAHRLLGTLTGLLLAYLIFSLPLNEWAIALLVFALTFIIENAVVRHYGFAVIFITPMALLLAEAATLGHTPAGPLMLARLLDTVLGCSVGLAGGFCLHSPRFRYAVGRVLRSGRNLISA